MRAKRIIAALMLLAAACFGARAQERKDDDGVPTVAYCDLLRDPASYDQKVIRVKVMYMSAFEGSSMYDLACERKDSWVVFDKEVETSTDRKLLKKFRRLSDASPVKTRKGIDHPVRIVEAVWVGMFQTVKRTPIPGTHLYINGFGHLNGYDYQFNVRRIEQVNKLPASAPR